MTESTPQTRGWQLGPRSEAEHLGLEIQTAEKLSRRLDPDIDRMDPLFSAAWRPHCDRDHPEAAAAMRVER
jgi:hypothetical protein